MTYKGGPQSFFGLGDTTIRRYGQNLLLKSSPTDNGFIQIPANILVRIERGNQYTINNGNGANLPTINFNENYDYREFKNEYLKTEDIQKELPTGKYGQYNLHTRIGVSKARGDLSPRTNYSDMTPGTQDKVNALSLYYSEGPNPEGTGVRDYNGKDVTYNPTGDVGIRDLIKFRIKSIDNDAPSKGYYMVFRAYINNIRRGVQSKWNPYSYIGRGENFYLYDGFTETISVSFTIAASSRYEMKPLYQKLNYLISTLTPDYSKSNRMRGSLSELTIGNFLLYQPGVITSLDMTIDEDSNWEIAIDEFENGQDKDMHELPQLIKCTMQFIPIYNFLPKKSTKSPFIGIDYFPNIKEGQKWLTDNSGKTNQVQNEKPKRKYVLTVGDTQKTDPTGKATDTDFSFSRPPE
jgi:hypothetical protein